MLNLVRESEEWSTSSWESGKIERSSQDWQAEVWATTEHGDGGVCEPSLAIKVVGRKVRLGAGEEGQHSLEDDSDLCVHHHSHSHTLLRETQLCFTPFFQTSQTFSPLPVLTVKDVARGKANLSSTMLPFYVTAHFQIQRQMALNMFLQYEYE